MKKFLQVTLIAAALFAIGCNGATNSPYTQAAGTGLIGGAALGAGAGALVGSMIKNGDVGQSALAGLAIGAASGVILGTAYVEIERQMVLSTNSSKIESNSQRIQKLTQELESRKQSELLDEKSTQLDQSFKEDYFAGPTIGVYTRRK